MQQTLKQLILDAGPLIGLFSANDRDHDVCQAGFKQLSQSQTTLLTPLPVIFEVYKWLLYRATPTIAQSTLTVMHESLHIIPLNQIDFHEISAMIRTLPQWQGSLEDASVILLAQRYQCPVWTLNYRDFGIFKSLAFWNPL
ncbi:type II toxin-antitoxin system VapC family toxin [Gloeocapsopsis sp. IPPAS B-1203]|uniref:type II toxin-antitoxin system VapC family toxin n=1 Tax=Gloeocapsopsis sp. IPPAS B-1203 TaxID=2049454 RepID=UPI000C18FBF9|nr:type II toxin-antitoxin system VapC family toxin [Gloeocapsopsis sp. IPPAS B-1203]PIG92865.1 VapC toxin family PIN domain ribonuclease [Gloeocapsopsis sp. IPPAS B-1203]